MVASIFWVRLKALKDTKIEIHRDVFGNKKNNPRLKGVSSRKDSNITTVKKGIFTSCNKNNDCPPWQIKAQEINHDKQKKIFDEVLPLVSEHMRPHNLYTNNSGDSAIRRLANKVKRIDRLIRVFQADQLGRPPLKVTEDPVSDWLAERSHQLELQASAPKPIILGRHLLAENLEPSPIFKTLLKECFEAQLDGNFDNETDGLIYLKSLLEKHNS